MTHTVETLLTAANAVIETVSVHDALGWLERPDVIFVDVRDAIERRDKGTVPGALSAPRGHLEFFADKNASLHKPEFASDKTLVIFCASGGRSTLASKTLMDMGIDRVVNLAGGYAAWQEAGGPIEMVRQ